MQRLKLHLPTLIRVGIKFFLSLREGVYFSLSLFDGDAGFESPDRAPVVRAAAFEIFVCDLSHREKINARRKVCIRGKYTNDYRSVVTVVGSYSEPDRLPDDSSITSELPEPSSVTDDRAIFRFIEFSEVSS